MVVRLDSRLDIITYNARRAMDLAFRPLMRPAFSLVSIHALLTCSVAHGLLLQMFQLS
jgi:hypothetical protein